MPRSGPTTLALPAFSGATRKLILVNIAVFFACAFLHVLAPSASEALFAWLSLTPATLLHGLIWQLLTYEFLPTSVLATLFAMLTLWFFGSSLEERFGGRWLVEFYLVAAAAGGLLASLLAAAHLLRLSPFASTVGAWTPNLALLMASAVVSGDEPVRFNFIITMKMKYLVGIYLLYFAAILFLGPDRFGALTCLCGALAGYGYMRFAPRKGLAFGVTERLYNLRNEYYRSKRRNAAKKFEVYMRKQNREVHFDKDGRYVDPDKDPTDKRWMN